MNRTQHQSRPHRSTSAADGVTPAQRHMYEAELALHVAHQSRVDAWITAAADRLHEAIVEDLRDKAQAR